MGATDLKIPTGMKGRRDIGGDACAIDEACADESEHRTGSDRKSTWCHAVMTAFPYQVPE